MSVESGDGSSTIEVYEAVDGSQKKAKNLYTRDFLLSLSELEVCKKLPSGYDQSLLSEFEDALHGVQDHPRSYSSLPFRRNDYSSSPPTRGDPSSLSRVAHGRKDTRASGWSDKDSDAQSDLDSDSGRRIFGNQSRQSRQNIEHDGLLGSGSFPRPSGFMAGTSAQKSQSTEHYQLNRTNLPYQPPRPFKTTPHSRTITHDSFNDETFGSNECTSQDKAEEERKRRASFELMRKEQQKVLQEKQKLNASKHKSDCFTDLMPEGAREKELHETNGQLDFANLSISNNDSGKASFASQSSTSRPLVPPGFRSTVLEKNSTAKPLIPSTEKQGNPAHTKDENTCGLNMGETIMSSSSGLKVPTEKIGMGDHHAYRISDLPELYEAFELPSDKPNENASADSASTRDAQSSKFAKWFHKDEKKPVDNLLSCAPNDLFSLIIDGEKDVIPVLNITSVPPVASVLTCEDLEQTILSENSNKTSISQPPVPNWTKNMPSVDNHATHHLLSLLQKETNSEKTIIPSNIEKHTKDGVISSFDNPKGPNLTLETLFGTDFMKELQSASGSARANPRMDHRIEPASDKVENNHKMLKFNEGTDIRLMENESFFPGVDTDATFEIQEKLAALSSGFRGEHFIHGPYDISNPERLTQLTHNCTMFDPVDPRFIHVNAHMRFPEHFRQHDAPNNHYFQANMVRPPFDHPDTRVTGFDIPANPQMQTLGSFPHQLVRDYERPSLVPPHPSNQGANFMPNAGAMHGFMGHRQPNVGGLGMPFHGSNSSSGAGMNHQEALERMKARQGMYGHELDMGFRYR